MQIQICCYKPSFIIGKKEKLQWPYHKHPINNSIIKQVTMKKYDFKFSLLEKIFPELIENNEICIGVLYARNDKTIYPWNINVLGKDNILSIDVKDIEKNL